MVSFKFSLPSPGSFTPDEKQQKYIDFVTSRQLLDKNMWRMFIDAFALKRDSSDRGWRGEFWGKMMRGGCLVYRCSKNEELYNVLSLAVIGLLETQDADGSFTSYKTEDRFTGWDMWCRKYVITGMLHFYDICPDEELKARIMAALKRHLDVIVSRVGDGEGKVSVFDTSDNWLGVNSCSILEPVADMCKRTNESRYREFAEYLISSGGCSGGDLIELALENVLAPYQYPETKAYETISYFEGVLAFYELTGEEKYLTAVKNFAEAVYKTDITLIGCAGCTHELFDNSAEKQTGYSDMIMQETCVTVTWMRFTARLFMLTGDEKYADRVEQSALNALYGSVNVNGVSLLDLGTGKAYPPLPFDSYSPLYMNRRFRGIGGLKVYPDKGFYGCCAAIGAAGIAVYPIVQSLRTGKKESPVLREVRLNNKIAFIWGPYVLARDGEKDERDISLPVLPAYNNGNLTYTLCEPLKDESVRLLLKTADGNVLLTDYASCGKSCKKERVTVWNNLI